MAALFVAALWLMRQPQVFVGALLFAVAAAASLATRRSGDARHTPLRRRSPHAAACAAPVIKFVERTITFVERAITFAERTVCP